MGRASADATYGLVCPDCATPLAPAPEGSNGVLRLRCPGCGGRFLAERPGPATGPHAEPSASCEPALTAPPLGPLTVGSVALHWRGLVLRILEGLYWSLTAAVALVLLALGGFVPVLRGWLRNEVAGWSDVVRTLGGAWFTVDPRNPDADLGPVLSRVDAPLLFSSVEGIARRLGVKPPGQVRLSYLPCCGVVAWRRSQALLIGLPLLRVLTQAELRSVLAHELAHLAQGDATRAARSARFVEGLERELERSDPPLWGPLGAWARFCLRESSWLIEPVARSQEARADRLAAVIAGGGVAASALVKVAVVQPLFREVLGSYDPGLPEYPNLYAFFRAFWFRLPPEALAAMRLQVLTRHEATHDPAHPPCPTAWPWSRPIPTAPALTATASRPRPFSATWRSSRRCSTTACSRPPASSPPSSTAPARDRRAWPSVHGLAGASLR